MADTPNQDRELGLPRERIGNRFLTAYDPKIALQIVERIAEGELLKDICARDNEHGFPAKSTFLKWAAREAELQRAYMAAKELSAYSFEEEAIETARASAKSPGTAQQVSAAQGLINQLRWSASRRDPKQYGDRANNQLTVPIHIHTSLDMGGGAGGGMGELPDIYTIEAVPIAEKPLIPEHKPEPKKQVLIPRLPMDADIQALKSEGKLPRSPFAKATKEADSEPV